MLVVIENKDTGERYIAKGENDCKSESDKSLYKEVMKFDGNYCVTMGVMLGYIKR